MRTILAEVGLVAVVLLGLAFVSGIFSSSTSALGKAELIVNVEPVYTSQGTYLEITLKNAGGRAVNIQSVLIDNTDVTQDLGWAGTTLEPGGELRTVIQAPAGLGPGSHMIKIVYEEGGQSKSVAAQFSS